jgi:hydroxylamine dehydrogenase
MRRVVLFTLLPCCFLALAAGAIADKISTESKRCLGCHKIVTPGIVADWQKSLHSLVTPTEALGKEKLMRRVSLTSFPEGVGENVVGCAECHTRNPDSHTDTFDHNGFKVHVVVTPEDCAACHPEERKQYADNLMSNAYANLMDNSVYRMLIEDINSVKDFNGVISPHADANSEDPLTDADSCLSCHGTVVEVEGLKSRSTLMGEMEFPVLTGWPNVGVGRINPDGSKGACTSCHPRHNFSIEVARKPYTCAQCHKGPDVPAYPVYMVSKHGNIFSSSQKEWNFNEVPWKVGVDFNAPTCATCHVSLVTTEKGKVVAERTHRMNDRLEYRLFGTIYATAHPIEADTSNIRNKAGLPLTSDLTGDPATDYLIGPEERQRRRETMQKLCSACHSQQWIKGHFLNLDRAIETTNAMTLSATKVMLEAWEGGAAKGLSQNESIFDETLEKMWVEQWLFYANSIRFASSMGGADYGVFANGRWHQSKNLQMMVEWLELKSSMSPAPLKEE